MKLDKFKSLTGNVKTPDLPDNAYIKSLYDLPQRSHRTPILPIISTVAAAVVLIFGITLWALIGRGVRGTDPGDEIQLLTPADGDKTPQGSNEGDGKKDDKPDKTQKDENKPSDGKTDDTDDGKNDDENDGENDGKTDDTDDTDKTDGKTDGGKDNDANSGNKVTLPEADNSNENSSGGTAVTPETPSTPSGGTEDNTPATDPFEERKLSAERAESSVFTFETSPLFNKKGNENLYAMPSFDIEMTGFVRDGTKLSDLKGKTLALFTSPDATWSYRNEKGKTVDEFAWFVELKDELGLNVSYTHTPKTNLAASSKKNMLAGKQLDLLYATGGNMLENLCLSRDITSLINIDDGGSSPGICKKTMDGYALSGGYRVIAPIGNVDVLWYNNSDALPTTYWRRGEWDYEKFKSYNNLRTFTQDPTRIADVWSCTSGVFGANVFTGTTVPTVTNNWGNTSVQSTIDYIDETIKSTEFSFTRSSDTIAKEYKALYTTTGFNMSATLEPMTDHTAIAARNLKICWVPYPKNGESSSGRHCAPSLGYGLMLPKTTVTSSNVGAALKFCELWASRATESILDNLSLFTYYDYTDDERREYYDFCVNNTVTPLYLDIDFGDSSYLYEAFAEDSFTMTHKVKTEWKKTSTVAGQEIIARLKEYSI